MHGDFLQEIMLPLMICPTLPPGGRMGEELERIHAPQDGQSGTFVVRTDKLVKLHQHPTP